MQRLGERRPARQNWVCVRSASCQRPCMRSTAPKTAWSIHVLALLAALPLTSEHGTCTRPSSATPPTTSLWTVLDKQMQPAVIHCAGSALRALDLRLAIGSVGFRLHNLRLQSSRAAVGTLVAKVCPLASFWPLHLAAVVPCLKSAVDLFSSSIVFLPFGSGNTGVRPTAVY